VGAETRRECLQFRPLPSSYPPLNVALGDIIRQSVSDWASFIGDEERDDRVMNGMNSAMLADFCCGLAYID